MKSSILFYFKILVIFEAFLSILSIILIRLKPQVSQELFMVFLLLSIPIFALHFLLKKIEEDELKEKERLEAIRKKKEKENAKKEKEDFKSNRIFNEKTTIDNEEDLKKWRKDFFKSKTKEATKPTLPNELIILGFKIEEIDLINKKEIKKRYLLLAKKYHPDKKYGNEESMKKINEAYQEALKTYKV